MPIERSFVSRGYWETRFQTEACYDWVATWDEVCGLLKKSGVSYSPVPHDTAVVYVPGIGSSMTALELLSDGFKNVICTDYAETAIVRQAELFARLASQRSTMLSNLCLRPSSFADKVSSIVNESSCALSDDSALSSVISSACAAITHPLVDADPETPPPTPPTVACHVACATASAACGLQDASVDVVVEKSLFDCLLQRDDCEGVIQATVNDAARVLRDGGHLISISMHIQLDFGDMDAASADVPDAPHTTAKLPDSVFESYYDSAKWESVGGAVRRGDAPVLVNVYRRKPRVIA